MKRWIPVIVAVVALPNLLVPTPPVHADSTVVGSTLLMGGQFHRFSFVLPDQGVKQKHPKRAFRSELVVDSNLLKGSGWYHLFCFDYIRWPTASRPNRGHVRVSVEVIRTTGEQIQVAELSAAVAGHTANACTPWFDGSLHLGDVVLFEFRFRKMQPFDSHSSGATFLGRVDRIYEDIIYTPPR